MLHNTRKPSSGAVWVMALALMAGLAMSSSVSADEWQVLEIDTARAVSDVQVPASMMTHLTAAQLTQAEETTEITRTEVAARDDFSSPIAVNIAYSLYSDYIFRFVNFSEYPGEGREKPNHQLATDFTIGLGDFGAFTYGAWFEWYAAQKQLNGEGANIQEIDHWFQWSYSIDEIMTDIAVGMTFYTFPNAKVDNTLEYYFTLSHNDAWMWKWLFPDNEKGVLNPSFLFAHDVDALGGVWMELAVSHDFELFENFTLTPGMMHAIDGCYWVDNTFRSAGTQYSLIATYDISGALQFPAWAGSLTIAGELYFNNASSNLRSDGVANDELWGGMTVAWAWGG